MVWSVRPLRRGSLHETPHYQDAWQAGSDQGMLVTEFMGQMQPSVWWDMPSPGISAQVFFSYKPESRKCPLPMGFRWTMSVCETLSVLCVTTPPSDGPTSSNHVNIFK